MPASDAAERFFDDYLGEFLAGADIADMRAVAERIGLAIAMKTDEARRAAAEKEQEAREALEAAEQLKRAAKTGRAVMKELGIKPVSVEPRKKRSDAGKKYVKQAVEPTTNEEGWESL